MDTFVREGVTDTREMKRLLKIIVKTEIFKNENLPEPTNKRFFPRTSTIRNHVTHANKIMSLSNRPRMFTRKNRPVGDSR